MPGAEGAGERACHHVDGAGIAHLGAKAGGGQGMGRAGHAFGPADKGQIGIAKHERLRTRNDGLKSRSAKAVDVHGGCAFGDACLHGGDAGQIHVARFGIDDMAKDRGANGGGIDPGAGDGGLCGSGGEVDGGNACQRSAEGADGGACAGMWMSVMVAPCPVDLRTGGPMLRQTWHALRADAAMTSRCGDRVAGVIDRPDRAEDICAVFSFARLS